MSEQSQTVDEQEKPSIPISENKEAQSKLSGETPSVNENKEATPDAPMTKAEDPAGYQKRMNSLYGKLKGTEREKERTVNENAELKKQLDELKSWKDQFESNQKNQEAEIKKAQFKKSYADAVEEGDGLKAAELLTEFNNSEPHVATPEIKKEAPPQPGARGKESFFKKYESVSNDENFIQLATKVNSELNETYANEISSGVLNDDGFMILLDREIESRINSGNQALNNFSTTGGITPGAPQQSNNQVTLTQGQKNIAARLYQDGVVKTLDEAYSRYAKQLGVN